MKAIATGIAVLALCTGCRVDGLAFRTDDRVEITAPQDGDVVTLPFELRWDVEDFEITGPDGDASDDAGHFAVLYDTAPMPPGEGLEYFGRDDDACRPADGCPDEDYLADRGIHLTERTSHEVTAIEDTRPIDRPSADDRHELTIILLDGQNDRIGESAFRVDIVVDRDRG